MTRVIVVVPTFNRMAYLNVVLNQLERQKIGDKVSLQTIVVNDGSTDGTTDMLNMTFPSVHIVNGDGSWFYTKSMNEGFKFARSLDPDFILTMNDDLEIDDNFVQEMIDAYSQVPDNSILGCISLTMEQPHRIFFSGVISINWWRYKFYEHYAQYTPLIEINNLDEIRPTLVLPGRGMLIPSSVLNKLSGFEEKFFQYNSDTDFCFRASKMNIGCYVSYKARIYSHHKLTGKGVHSLNARLTDVIENFYNKRSTLYLMNHIRNILSQRSFVYLPSALFFIITGNLYRFIRLKWFTKTRL